MRLASNAHEPTQAFRFGQPAWGVQFHPEFSADVMAGYIEVMQADLAAAGRDPAAIRVVDTPDSAAILRRFGDYVAPACLVGALEKPAKKNSLVSSGAADERWQPS